MLPKSAKFDQVVREHAARVKVEGLRFVRGPTAVDCRSQVRRFSTLVRVQQVARVCIRSAWAKSEVFMAIAAWVKVEGFIVIESWI